MTLFLVFLSSFEVIGIEADERKGIEIHGKGSKVVKARWLITCAGLQSDYIGHMAGRSNGCFFKLIKE